MSVQLPKDASSSTMARSVISAPMLTSTTNAKVAAAEGVQCRGTFTIEHCHETTAAEARHLAGKIETEHHRPGRRFVDVLKDKLRRRERSFAKLDEDTTSLGINRRRAETINLCKDKIKNLTGNGHIKRMSITDNTSKHAGIEHLLSRKESQAALIINRKTSQIALDFDSQHQPDNDSHFGSLSRSFNSALEKLDFQANHVPFLRSRSSIFNMRRPGEQQMGVPSVEPYHAPNTPRPAFAQMATTTSVTAATTAPEMPPNAEKPNTVEEGKMDGRATQLRFSPDKGYTAAAPDPNYPGGVNPLRMHTDVTAMARRPYKHEDEAEGEDEILGKKKSSDGGHDDATTADVLDEATTYSESMRDLSQYARTPPALKTDTPDLTPPSPTTNTMRNRQSGTPAMTSDQKGSSHIVKSKSYLGMFEIFKKGETPPMLDRSSSPHLPVTPSPLRHVHTARADDKKWYGMVGMPGGKDKKD